MRVSNDLLELSAVSLTDATSAFDLTHLPIWSATVAVSANNPANKDFETTDVDVTTDEVTITAHGYLTGAKCQLSTTDTLPAGLTTTTDYYLIRVDANTVKFATSQGNALAGTAIDITDAGVGTHTVEITASLAGSVKIQVNNEPESREANWVDLASSSTNFTGAGNLHFNYDNAGYRAVRAYVTVTSGTVAVSARFNAKGA